MDKKIKVAVLGCGNRGCGVVWDLLRDSNRNVEVVAAYDPNRAAFDRCTGSDHSWQWHAPNCKCCSSYQEAINTPGVEWVMVFSPNAFHKEQVVAAFEAGKNVFSEKPLATTIEDCQAMNEAHKKAGTIFATGFVLRYSKLYEKAKEILDSGVLGKLYAINADENITPEHGGYIMCNWRRLTKFAGPHILEKCCHDLDLINWFCGSLPSKVASFSTKSIFLPENDFLMTKYDRKIFRAEWNDLVALDDPFTSDKDLKDNTVSIAKFRNDIMVSFQCSMSNIIPERRMVFCCTEGTMKLDLYNSELIYRKLGEDYVHNFVFGVDGHGGGDNYIMKALYDTMCNGGTPKCSGTEGLASAVYALAIDKASTEGKIIDLEPIWEKLGK
jgi:predicted dehydrogenase